MPSRPISSSSHPTSRCYLALILPSSRSQVASELATAFAAWSEPTGVTFERAPSGGQVAVSFTDRREQNSFLFDGPGGALANATAESITFDSSERWELQG